MYDTLLNFPASLFGDFERLRREVDDAFGPAHIRAAAPGSFPPVNVGQTNNSFEVFAFAPGLDPSRIEVTIDRGVLTLSGERAPSVPTAQQARERKQTVYGNERASGRFQRAVNLPEDADPAHVHASYRDGVLQVSVARRESAQPRRIEVQ